MGKQARILKKIPGMEQEAQLRVARAAGWRTEVPRLLTKDARVHDVIMLKNPLIRRNKNGDEKTYYRWSVSGRKAVRPSQNILGAAIR